MYTVREVTCLTTRTGDQFETIYRGRECWLQLSKVTGRADIFPGHATLPRWSPDGGSLVFSGVPTGGSTAIHVLDMKTHRVRVLPGSQRLFSPRWSPDGRYIVAMSVSSHALMLFDFKTEKWSVLAKGRFGFPCRSRDKRYVYAFAAGRIGRIAIPGGKVQKVASLKGINITGFLGSWLGLTPDDAPMNLIPRSICGFS